MVKYQSYSSFDNQNNIQEAIEYYLNSNESVNEVCLKYNISCNTFRYYKNKMDSVKQISGYSTVNQKSKIKKSHDEETVYVTEPMKKQSKSGNNSKKSQELDDWVTSVTEPIKKQSKSGNNSKKSQELDDWVTSVILECLI